jgi:hypothetical protein
MTRIINVDSVGKERVYLTKAIVAAIRELAKQKEPGVEARDLVSFIIFSLDTISVSIETSVIAWEKRDYWVKADRFRLEWAWAGKIAVTLRAALFDEDWGSVVRLAAEIGQKLSKIKVSDNHRLGTPWKGNWSIISKQAGKAF